MESSIAGMPHAQRKLHGLIRRPIECPDAFASLPINLSRGILLYGPAGCGKTYLMQRLTEAHAIRYVSICGPEMLDKYVGASEAKVRDLFERAQSMAPAVIVIDDLDACAPQRGEEGGDHTGITDRVVNQLLCEMDGVYVIAATSRPEVIDNALLRPGRLDTHIHCPLQSHAEREATLRLFGDKLEINIPWYAAHMEGWRYADIRSAFDRSVHETIAASVATHVDPAGGSDVGNNVRAPQVRMITPGSVDDADARARLEELRERGTRQCRVRDASWPELVVSADCFARVVAGMRPSVQADESGRIAMFARRGRDGRAIGQQMAVV